MSPEMLQAIRERDAEFKAYCEGGIAMTSDILPRADRTMLLAEVDRLKAENVEMRAALVELADSDDAEMSGEGSIAAAHRNFDAIANATRLGRSLRVTRDGGGEL